MEEKKSYTSIFKSTSLFASVQVVSIIISIIKSKLVAIWIGTIGFGIISIFNSSISLITSITNLGIQSSAIREIASISTDVKSLSKAVTVTNKLAIYTSLLGASLTVIFSPFLSHLFFHTYNYTYSFILLALVVFFTGMYNQYYAVLQGTHKLKQLAISSLSGALLGLLFSIPCFFFFHENGIVPSLVISSVSIMIISYIYVRKLAIKKHNISFKDVFRQGSSTVKLGIYIALSNNVTFLTMFLLKAFISNSSTIEDVGLFQAGWSLNAQYIGVVLTAMSKDYFPRLSKIAKNNELVSRTMSEQGEIGLLLIVPVLTFLLTFINFFIVLLYSTEFLLIVPMTKLLLLGTIVQIAGWGLGYVFLAKNNGKVYFFNEVGSRIILFPLYIVGYRYDGLEGLGYAFILNQIIYFFLVAAVAYNKYDISYTKQFYMQLLLVIFTISTYYIIGEFYSLPLIVELSFCFGACAYSIIMLINKLELIKNP